MTPEERKAMILKARKASGSPQVSPIEQDVDASDENILVSSSTTSSTENDPDRLARMARDDRLRKRAQQRVIEAAKEEVDEVAWLEQPGVAARLKGRPKRESRIDPWEHFGETDIYEPLPVSKQPAERIGPESRTASVLTDDDLMKLATQSIFPKDLELSETMAQPGMFGLGPIPVSIESQYPTEGSKYDRFMFLVERRNEVRDERIHEIWSREMKPRLARLTATGVALGSGVSWASSAVKLAPLLKTMSRVELANLIVDHGMELMFEAPLMYMVYDWATSDDEDKRIEDLEHQVEQLVQQKQDDGQ